MGAMKIAQLVLDLFVMFNSIIFIPRAADHPIFRAVSSPYQNESACEGDGGGSSTRDTYTHQYPGANLASPAFNRSSFPKGFTFGTSSSSYQYEGAYKEDGKGLNVWDTYNHRHPESVADGSNGDIAVDQYHRYKEDVALMKNMGMDAYRFSISWSRVLPLGKLSGGVNKKGIKFYNNLINELLSKGLQPYVTLFHEDLPQHLEDEYNGLLSSRIVQDFQDYAELCFKEFGDRVKHWITINEPGVLSIFYNVACFKSDGNCSVGNSGTIPYIAAHNQLLAHAAAVKIYKEKYQANQKGKIGITLIVHWMVPISEAKADKDAAQRAIEFMYGWFMDPLTYGEYPKNMQTLCRNRLPKFTKNQSDMIKGSYDFIGINYYTAFYVANNNISMDSQEYSTDSRCSLTAEKNGIPLGPKGSSTLYVVYPRGLLNILKYTKRKYNNPTIYITENGIDEKSDTTLSLEEALADRMRIDYHSRHLSSLLRAINEGIDVRGYFAWTLMDCFEWIRGYTTRYGLNYVDRETLIRYPKHSSNWFKKSLLR